MGIHAPWSLSLGEWAVTVKGWNDAHGEQTMTPPSDDEFEIAVTKTRGGYGH